MIVFFFSLSISAIGQDSIGFKVKSGIIIIPATINKTKSWLIVDSGSAYTYLNQKIANELRFDYRSLDASVAGFGGNEKLYEITSPVTVEFIDVKFTRGFNKASDLSAFSKLLNLDVAGILGNDFLFWMKAKIDFESKTVILTQ